MPVSGVDRIWIAEFKFKMKNIKFKMVAENLSDSIFIKFGTWRFLKLLFMNEKSKFLNSKWRIQYGARKFVKGLDFNETWYSGVF